jgi:nucleoid DNA-binding protein
MDSADRKEIVEHIRNTTGLRKKDVERVLSEEQQYVSDLLRTGVEVKYYRFGILRPVTVDARYGVLPDGETMLIPAHKVIRFYPSKTLREYVNQED